MSNGEHGTPLQLTITQDVSDAFRAPGDCDSGLAIEKRGSINIDQTWRNKRQEFEIYLIDKQYRKGTPAIINVNLNGLFDLVQTCRKAWEQAIEGLTTMRPDATGAGQNPYRPYENAWDKPIDAATFHRLAGKLAVAGEKLFSAVFERNRGTLLDQIAAKLREVARSGRIGLTVHAADFHIPWRMLYTHPQATEALKEDGANFEPAGFWGYQLVIEQFTKDYDIKDHVLARNGKLGFGAALHEGIDTDFKVECVKRHRDFVAASANRLIHVEWTEKTAVTKGLAAEPFDRQVVYFLCHAEGAGSSAAPALESPYLKLADGCKIDAVAIRESVCSRFEPSPPLIFINACRGGQLGTLVKHNFTFATEFLEQGAVCVVGPQIEVPAVFAGEFGKRFFERFIAQTDPPPQVGLILRDLTCEMWEHHNPFGLVYSLYAGADCHIRWTKEGVA
jgi:CHAT domain